MMLAFLLQFSFPEGLNSSFLFGTLSLMNQQTHEETKMKFQTQTPSVTVDHRAIRNELYRTLKICRKANGEWANLQTTMKNIQKIIKRSKSQPSKTRKGQ